MTVATSALLVNVVVTVDEGPEPLLFPGVGSAVSEVLRAVLAIVPLLGTVTLTVLLALEALGISTIAGNVTIPVTGLYVPLLEALTPVKPGIRLSVMTTLVAGLGPLLLAVIV